MNREFFKILVSGFVFLTFISCQTAKTAKDVKETWNSYQVAENFIKQEKYAEAVAELEKALKIDPNALRLHQQMGRALTLKKNFTEADVHLKRADSIDANNPITLSYLGKLHFDQKDFQKALVYKLEAHRLLPEHPSYVYEIGKCYQMLNDNPNAIKYYSMYLKSGRESSKKLEIVNFLKEQKAEIPVYQHQVLTLLEAKKFSEADQILKSLQQTKSVDENGESEFAKVYTEIVDMNDARNILTEWKNKIPKSALALSLLGSGYTAYAWEARGGGYNKSVSVEALTEFKKRLEQAKIFYDQAIELDPTNLFSVTGLVMAGKANLKLDINNKKLFIKYNNRSDPDNFYLQKQMLDSLTPKWGGNLVELMNFARFQLDSSAPNSKAPLLLPLAHWDIALDRYPHKIRSYFEKPINWEESKKGLDIAVQRFPNSVEVRTLYLRTALYANYPREARLQYEKIKDRMELKYFTNPEEMLEIKRIMEMGAGI
jgi:tetratricopeptide (TPR) repeat protein